MHGRWNHGKKFRNHMKKSIAHSSVDAANDKKYEYQALPVMEMNLMCLHSL
jgi:hypothetical protein